MLALTFPVKGIIARLKKEVNTPFAFFAQQRNFETHPVYQ
jgi:hypothetical protein